MIAFVIYNKNSGEILEVVQTNDIDAMNNHPNHNEYFCDQCDESWYQETIEMHDIIYDVSEGDEFDYVIQNSEKSPPYLCPRCSSELELQSNYLKEEISIEQFRLLNNSETEFVKSPDGKIEQIVRFKTINDLRS